MRRQRGFNRDYLPAAERNVEERMSAGASLKDGVSGRMEATRRRPHYRRHGGKAEAEDPMDIMLFGGMFDE